MFSGNSSSHPQLMAKSMLIYPRSPGWHSNQASVGLVPSPGQNLLHVAPIPGISRLPLSPLLVQIDLPTPGWWDKYCSSGWHPLFDDNNIVLVLDTNMISWWKHKIGSWTSHVLGMNTRAVRDIVWCWKASVCWVEKHVLLIVNHKFFLCVLENKLCWWFEPQ